MHEITLRRLVLPTEYCLRATGQAVEQQDSEHLAALTTADVVHLPFAEEFEVVVFRVPAMGAPNLERRCGQGLT
jgi:hypothetical protein